MSSVAPADLFDAQYYATGCGSKYERNQAWLDFFGRIAERIIADIGPDTVLDAGCALGLLVEGFRTRGVAAFGRDISTFAINSVHSSIAPYCELGSIAEPLPQRYDLIVSIEVLEHMQPEQARAAIVNLCRYTDDILFSSTPFDYKEVTHFNVQPPEYWAEMFAQQGFFRDVDYDASYITEWAVRFRRRSDPPHRIVRDYERGYWVLRKENQDLRNLALELRRAAPPPTLVVPQQGLQDRSNVQGSTLAAALDDLSARSASEVAQRELVIQDLRNRWAALEASPGYAIMTRMQRMRAFVAPPQSSRDHILESALRIVRAHNLPTLRTESHRIGDEIRQQLGFMRGRAQTEVYEHKYDDPTLVVDEASLPPAVHPHTADVDIIVCIHNALADVRRCLDSVHQHTLDPYRLILVDDGSDRETREYLAAFANQLRDARRTVQLIRNEYARGYTLAANQGLRASTSEFVVLLNSDTVVAPGWLDRMVTCALTDSSIGVVGPLSNCATWQSVPEIIEGGEFANNPLPEGFTVADMAEALDRHSARIYPRVPFLNGFCLLVRRSVIQRVGLFDEENFGVGYGEENDYCLRVRAAGWQLAIADDSYVYHAGSKSYSDAKRRALSDRANEMLKRKHNALIVESGVEFLAENRVMRSLRAHAAVAPEQERLMRLARQNYAGRKFLWLLPVMFPGGGGAVVAAKAQIMRNMGVDVTIFNLEEYREGFERSYPTLDVPVVYGCPEDVRELGARFDAVVATHNVSAYWLLPLASQAPQTALGYFIQDFEPYFFEQDSPEYKLAWASYSLIPQMRRFATTTWIRDQVVQNTGMDCGLVGGCYNADLFRSRPRALPEWPERPLRIAAMIRPSSPYRGARLTMEVLREVSHRFGAQVEIRLFGVNPLEQRFLDLPRDFPWRLAGSINQRQVAMFLNEADIFVDFSVFQALGITAQEAMSCGAAVIVPTKGGASTFARHEDNCLMVDSSSVEECVAALVRLVQDHSLRERIQRKGMYDVCAFHPELPTYNILKTMFE